jgi:hypothetical protein
VTPNPSDSMRQEKREAKACLSSVQPDTFLRVFFGLFPSDPSLQNTLRVCLGALRWAKKKAQTRSRHFCKT